MTALDATKDVNFLESLIPQDSFYTDKTPEKDRRKAIVSYGIAKQEITALTRQAVAIFAERLLAQFDALVGDQACQIRCLKLAMILKNDRISEQMAAFEERIATIDPLREDIPISKDLLTLISCYLLAQAKDTAPSQSGTTFEERANSKKLIQSDEISKIKRDTLLYDIKRKVAEISVSFVKEMAESLDCSIPDPLKVGFGSYSHKELPFYTMTKVIFLKAAEQKLPVLVKIRHEESSYSECGAYAFYEADESLRYVQSEGVVQNVAGPWIVIEGITSSSYSVAIDKINAFGLMQMIFANAAQHKQYTIMPSYVADEELANTVQFAIEEGFSMINKSGFCIDHIFCDLLQNQIQ